jgi:hypothetical protein
VPASTYLVQPRSIVVLALSLQTPG